MKKLKKLVGDGKSLNRLNTNIIHKEVEMKQDEKELEEAFDRLEGCILFDGNGADLAKEIRKNGFIKLKGA